MVKPVSNNNANNKPKPNRVLGVVERVAQLEKTVGAIISGLNNELTRIGRATADISQVIDAVVDVVGQQRVQEQLDANQIKAKEEQAKAESEQLAKLLEAGSITTAETASESCLLVGVEYTSDGKPIPPGRLQLAFGQLASEQMKKDCLGKKVGDKIDVPGGGVFEILEIYEKVKVAAEPKNSVPTESLTQETGAAAETETPAT